MVILILLSFPRFLVIHPTNFQNNFRSTIQFIDYCGLIFWLVYLSEFRLKLLIEDGGLEKLNSSKIPHDITFTFTPFLLFQSLRIHNDPNWATEMFIFGRAFFVTLGGLGSVSKRIRIHRYPA